MTLIVEDRVRDTSLSTGAGPTGFVVQATPPINYRTFSTVLVNGDTFPYCIVHQTVVDEWEVGLGTYASANTFTRTTVVSSSNAGSHVAFSAGTKDVFITHSGTPAAANMIELGHETDTTLARASAGDASIEGNIIYRAGGTDVPVADGGTGGSTAAEARANVGVGYALLSQGTHSGTSLNFTGLDPATIGTVKGFVLELTEIEPAGDWALPQMQLGDSGGLDTGATDYSNAYIQHLSTDDVVDSSNFDWDDIIISGPIGNAAAESGSCVTRIGTNDTAPATHNLVRSDHWELDGDTAITLGWWAGRRIANINLDRFSVTMDDASSFTCTYRLLAIE